MYDGADSMTNSLVRPERGLLLLFIPIASLSLIGMILAELGVFTLGRALAGTAILTIGGWVFARRDLRSEPEPVAMPRWVALLFAAALLVAAPLFSQPGEYLVEGYDSSVYLAIGESVYRTGALVTADPLLSLIPAEDRPALMGADRDWPHLVNRFPGGIQITTNQDLVVPNFFHLLPVWIAVFLGLAGPQGGYYVNVVFASLSVLVTGLIGRRAWSAPAGTVSALLLAVNFGQVWYARQPSSEILAQFLLLAAILFTLMACDRHSRIAGACAGAAVGLAGLVRIDVLFLFGPLGVVWLVLARRRGLLGWAWPWFATTLIVTLGHAFAHAFTVSAPYTTRLAVAAWQAAWRLASSTSAGGGTMALLLVAALGAAVALSRRVPRVVRAVALAVLLVGVVAVFAPGVALTVSHVLTPFGVVAAVAGFCLVLRDMNPRLLPVVVPFTAEAVLWFAWRERTTWPSDFRRLVPVVLPVALLFAGVLVARLLDRRDAPWTRGLAWLLPLGAVGMSIAHLQPVLRDPPMRGVHEQVARLADRIPAQAVVLADGSVPSHLPLALQYAFGRSGLFLPLREPPGRALRDLVDRLAAAGRPVYLLLDSNGGEGPRRLRRSDFDGFDVRKADLVPFRYTALVASAIEFPRLVRTADIGIELYEIVPLAQSHAVAVPVVLDVGERDFAFVFRGFYAAEPMPSARARWTSGDAQVSLPLLQVPEAAGVTLVLRLAAYRPEGVAPPHVQLSIDRMPVGTVEHPGPDFAVFEVVLPAAAVTRLRAGPARLSITSDTFVPKSTGGSQDERELGIALDWIRLQEGMPRTAAQSRYPSESGSSARRNMTWSSRRVSYPQERGPFAPHPPLK